MLNPSGSIILNGITDSEMVKVWEFKAHNDKAFTFNPQQFQVISANQPRTTYNNVKFDWSGEAGLKVMHEILGYLLNKEEQAQAAAQ